MKQNIYDHPDFFNGYKALRLNDTGLNGILEEPALRSLLPQLEGLTLLDIGCGFGHFCRYARDQKAKTVFGLDISSRMIRQAKKMTADRYIHYECVAVEDFRHSSQAFDLAVSSLAFHYVRNWKHTIQNISKWLKPGGIFVFSVEHPIYTASMKDWKRDSHGKPLHIPVDHYCMEGKRLSHWFVDGVIKYHRTLSTYINTLVDSGFVIERLLEPRPSQESIQQCPDFERFRRCPPFLLIRARKDNSPLSAEK